MENMHIANTKYLNLRCGRLIFFRPLRSFSYMFLCNEKILSNCISYGLSTVNSAHIGNNALYNYKTAVSTRAQVAKYLFSLLKTKYCSHSIATIFPSGSFQVYYPYLT